MYVASLGYPLVKVSATACIVVELRKKVLSGDTQKTLIKCELQYAGIFMLQFIKDIKDLLENVVFSTIFNIVTCMPEAR